MEPCPSWDAHSHSTWRTLEKYTPKYVPKHVFNFCITTVDFAEKSHIQKIEVKEIYVTGHIQHNKYTL
jgi:hypothetical protein